MNQILIFILGVIVGGIAMHILSKKGGKAELSIIDKQAADKKKLKEDLLDFLDFIESQGQITNDQIQQMLDMSDATVTRYLDELEKEGKIRQVGQTGRSVYYEKI